MNTKLTLRIDKQLIQATKEYSAKSGKSLSRIVSDFFKIIRNEKLTPDKGKISPTVRTLKGILKESKLNEDDYKKYIENKYL